MTELRPLREDEFDDWAARSMRDYADNMHEHGGIPVAEAETKSKEDHARLFPDWRVPEGHFVYVIEDGGAVRGHLWLAERDGVNGGAPHLFVYGILIDEDARGRGIGRAAMTLAEGIARERGLGRIELNVFGGNDVARGLYRSLGYDEVAVYMGKDL
ncbi:MAG TPA: GNAT family N-acetyltransferase [Gaiellaceae bacterium]|nr:GNAT family N-acetyltransferase [Gaiellaceae bacterium]